MNWSNSIDFDLPGNWQFSFEYGITRTHMSVDFYTRMRHRLGMGLGSVSQAVFHVATWFAWFRVSICKVKLEIPDEVLWKSLDDAREQAKAQEAWAQKAWPAWAADCADCPVNCQSFHMSDDCMHCDLFNMPIRQREEG